MRSLRFDPNCRDCRKIDLTTIHIAEITVGCVVGYLSPNLHTMLLMIVVMQPVIWGVIWATNKIQPMSHHMFEEDL